MTAPSSDSVFQDLIVAIVSGKFPENTRLPPERELAKQLGTSRPTLREVLGKLSTMHLVRARRGSGVLVRPMRDWGFDVVPYALVAGLKNGTTVTLVKDIFELRKANFRCALESSAGRVTAEELKNTRELVEEVWEARANFPEFIRKDMEVWRELTFAARSFPSMWLLNSISDVYEKMALHFASENHDPGNYRDAYLSMLDAVERGDGKKAGDIICAYLESREPILLARIGLL